MDSQQLAQSERLQAQLYDAITAKRMVEPDSYAVRQSMAIHEVEALLDEVIELREALNRSRAYRESMEGLPEGTLPRV